MATTPEKKSSENKPLENRSYLSETLSAFSPWASRSSTPKPTADASNEDGVGAFSKPSAQRGGDHSIRPRHRFSQKDYPEDCPKLTVQWYHAVDVS